MDESSPNIPQQCGNNKAGVDWSSLSKTQKKRAKAKIKDKNNVSTDAKDSITKVEPIVQTKFSVNPFTEHSLKVQSLPKITINDPLITAIQNIIDHQLGTAKLNQEELTSMVDHVNGLGMPDWWNMGLGVKTEMLSICFLKFIKSDKDNIL